MRCCVTRELPVLIKMYHETRYIMGDTAANMRLAAVYHHTWTRLWILGYVGGFSCRRWLLFFIVMSYVSYIGATDFDGAADA